MPPVRGGSPASNLTTTTDSYGNARAYYETGLTSSPSNVVIVTAGLSSVDFIAYSATSTSTPVAGGGEHNLLVESNGTVWAWGDNANGQLGDGTTENRSSPVQVNNLANVVAVAAGGYHSIALKTDGTVWTWGDDEYGQLGIGAMSQSNTPVQVSGISGVIAIAAGYSHSLALKNDGTIWAWGYNGDGELGNSSTFSSSTPVPVSNIAGIIAISTRGYHSLALRNDGTIWAWGYNASGQLGNGATASSDVPVEVIGLSATAVAIAAGGYHSVAITSDNKIWTWGDNGFGQLGESTTTTNSASPYQVTLPGSASNPVMIAAEDYDTMVLRANGTVDVFGDNEDSQLGNGTDAEYQDTPAALSGISGITSIAAGGEQAFAQTSSGAINSWGDNSLGQLGLGTTIEASGIQTSNCFFGLLNSFSVFHVTQPMANGGAYHSIALRADGTVWTCGNNYLGELGNGALDGNAYQTLFTQVPGLTKVVGVSGGTYFSIALRSDGSVWSWGDNSFGELGNGTTVDGTNAPAPIPSLGGIVAIASGYTHNLALKSDGTVWAWGDNNNGDLGNGGYAASNVPIQVLSLTDIVAVACGENQSYAVKNDGTVWSWGANTYATLGNNSFSDSNVPVQVSGLSGITSVKGGLYQAFALKNDGTVWAWGYNGDGELGIGGSPSYSEVPIQVLDLSNVVSIASTENRGLALKSDGTLWGWGGNYAGTGGTTSSIPVQISGVTSIVGIGGSLESHLYAIRVDGTLFTWGYGADGELGYGSNSGSTTPESASGFNLKTVSYGMSVGDSHSQAYRTDGTLLTWGNNSNGQLGNWNTVSSFLPYQNSSVSGVVGAASGTSFSSAITIDGSIWTWGSNNAGQLGIGTTTNFDAPIKNSSISGILMAATGLSHTAVVKADNTVWTWGNNSNGQLGNGSVTNHNSPVEVNSSTLNGDAFQVAAGSQHTVALKRDGTIWTWGHNQYGQLGNGSTMDSSSPIQLSSLTGIYTAVAAGASHTVALCSDGTIWTWGYNGDGELGNGLTTNSSSPARISEFTNVVAIAATGSDTYALKGDGTVWAWGTNNEGQLGIGTTTGSTSPVELTSLSHVIALATGSSANHMLAMEDDGSIWAWGDNVNGDLGDGTSIQRNTPVKVATINLLQYPTVSLNGSPSAIYNTLANIPLTATVSDPQGYVKQVDYYAGSTLIGSESASPYSILWTHVSAGTYVVTAVATDLDGSTTVSAPMNVTVVTFGYSQVVANNNDSYALRSDGTVWGWGQNNSGDLGAGVLSEQLGPAWTAGLSNVISMAAGGAHAIALTSSGAVWTWGDNVDGDLGLDTSTADSLPQNISSLSNVVGVAAGNHHGVALASDGTVWVWGDNTYGQLGTGNNTSQSSPVQISPVTLNGVIAIAAANNETMALKADGTVWMWGSNAEGQLGNGTTTSSFNVPTQVSSLTGVVTISCGQEHAAAVTSSGNVYIWGDNTYGELGNSTTTQSNTPVPVSGLSNIASIACGNEVSFAVKTNGTVYVWGNNAAGQLGLGSTTTSFNTPQADSSWNGVTQFACGSAHTLGSRSDGTIWASGSQSSGQLGGGIQDSSNVIIPVKVTSLTGYLGISSGDAHSLGFKNDGTVWSWGNNANGQLGDGMTTSSSVPVQTSIMGSAVGVAAGTGFSLALGEDGTVWSWGSNSEGQLGASTNYSFIAFPSPVSDISNIIQVAAGSATSVVLREDGTVWGWGAGAQGQLGNGAISNSSVPVEASGVTEIVQVAGGSQHVVALQSNGTVWTWGNNSNGQLGNNSTSNSSVPVQVSTSYLSNILAIGAGAKFSVALKSDGTVWTWGYNGEGELGIGSTTQSSIPVEITGLSNVVAITVGASQVFALQANGTLMTWGLNSGGQLGVGTTTDSHSPTSVSGAPNNITSFTDGSSASHSILIAGNNSIYAWGDNSSGDLGDGTTTQRSSPILATDVSTGPLSYTVTPTITLTEPDGATLLP